MEKFRGKGPRSTKRENCFLTVSDWQTNDSDKIQQKSANRQRLSDAPDLNQLLEEPIQELRVAQHSEGVSGRSCIDDNPVKLDVQFILSPHKLQHLYEQSTFQWGQPCHKQLQEGGMCAPQALLDRIYHSVSPGGSIRRYCPQLHKALLEKQKSHAGSTNQHTTSKLTCSASIRKKRLLPSQHESA